MGAAVFGGNFVVRGQFSSGTIILGGNCLGGSFPRGQLSGGQLSAGGVGDFSR